MLRRLLAVGLLAVALVAPASAQVFNDQTVEQHQTASGWSFISGSSMTAVGIGASLRFTIANPSGSTRSCFVSIISAYSTQQAFARIRINPTTNLPSTARPEINLSTSSSNVANCQVAADVGAAMTGGTDTGIDLAFSANTWVDTLARTFLIAPGTTFAISVPITIAASVDLVAAWYEQPVVPSS